MSRDVLDLASSLGYLDDLAARFRDDPAAIDPSWYEVLDGHARSTNGHAAAAPAEIRKPIAESRSAYPLVERVPRARPLRREPRSARPARDRARRRARSGDVGLADDGTPRVEPTACTACRPPRRSPSSSRICAACTAARSASSSCTSRRRRGARGSPSAWRRTRSAAAAARCPHAHARAARQRRAVRAVLPHEVSRHEAVLARGRREPDPAARSRAHARARGSARSRPCSAWRTAGGSPRSSRSCARPGASCSAQFEDVEPEKALGGGDVKYHLGFSTRPRRSERQRDAPVARVQPEPPRGGRPGRRRPRAREADAPRRRRARGASSASSSTATPRSPGRGSWPRR